MIQLTKKGDSSTLYQTIYTEGRLIVQYQGIVGAWVRAEDVRQMRVSRFKRLGVQLLRLVEEFERQGYHKVNETDYQELIVQFPYDDTRCTRRTQNCSTRRRNVYHSISSRSDVRFDW